VQKKLDTVNSLKTGYCASVLASAQNPPLPFLNHALGFCRSFACNILKTLFRQGAEFIPGRKVTWPLQIAPGGAPSDLRPSVPNPIQTPFLADRVSTVLAVHHLLLRCGTLPIKRWAGLHEQPDVWKNAVCLGGPPVLLPVCPG
jgi:hypothetical protein